MYNRSCRTFISSMEARSEKLGFTIRKIIYLCKYQMYFISFKKTKQNLRTLKLKITFFFNNLNYTCQLQELRLGSTIVPYLIQIKTEQLQIISSSLAPSTLLPELHTDKRNKRQRLTIIHIWHDLYPHYLWFIPKKHIKETH